MKQISYTRQYLLEAARWTYDYFVCVSIVEFSLRKNCRSELSLITPPGNEIVHTLRYVDKKVSCNNCPIYNVI